MNDKSLCGDARLPIVDDPRLHGSVDGIFEICRWHDHKRIAAAELEYALLDSLCRGASDARARGLASGQSRRLHAIIVDDLLNLLGRDQQRLKFAVRKSGVAKNGLDGNRALRNIRCVLE